MPRVSEPARDNSQPIEAVRGIASGAVLILGSTYALGALEKTAQLGGADLAASDVFPLIPLEQVLLSGMQSLLSWGLLGAVTVLVYLALAERRERREPDAESRFAYYFENWRPVFNRPTNWADALVQGVVLLAAVGGLLLVTPAMAINIILVWFLLWLLTPRIRSMRRVLVLVALAFLLVVVLSDYIEPDPLPAATASLSDGQEVAGSLVTSNPSSLVLGLGDRQVVVIPAESVKEVEIVSPEPSVDSRTIFSRLLS